MIDKKYFQTAIVGGGLTGILLALKLSKNVPPNNQSIVLFEEKGILGGRHFFSPSFPSTQPLSKETFFNAVYQHTRNKEHTSGRGFEFEDPKDLEILYRYITSLLTDDEMMIFEELLEQQDCAPSILPECYFIKKDIINSNALLSSTNNFFTKKEGEILENFLMSKTQQDDIKAFEDHFFWKSVEKSVGIGLIPILNTLFTPHFKKFSTNFIKKNLASLIFPKNLFIPPSFLRQNALELLIQQILEKRGVVVKTLCPVIRISQKAQGHWQFIVADDFEPKNKEYESFRVIFTLPLMQCASLISKEFFTAEQSRFMSKALPISQVVCEYKNFASLCQNPMITTPCIKLIFPAERAIAYVSSDGRALFTTYLDYEDSLQSPSVREAVGRLRRAAARVVSETHQPELKKGPRMPQNEILERVVLVSVESNIQPYLANPNATLTKFTLGRKNLYHCSDEIFSSENTLILRAIKAVQSFGEN